MKLHVCTRNFLELFIREREEAKNI
jgi:hypothetical protein